MNTESILLPKNNSITNVNHKNKHRHIMSFISLNACVIFTAVIITLFILDYYNPFMGFLSRSLSIVVFVLWGISAALTVLLQIRRIIRRS